MNEDPKKRVMNRQGDRCQKESNPSVSAMLKAIDIKKSVCCKSTVTNFDNVFTVIDREDTVGRVAFSVKTNHLVMVSRTNKKFIEDCF